MTILTDRPNLPKRKSSRISGFHQQPLPQRLAFVAAWAGLDSTEQAALIGMGGLSTPQAEQMIENVVGIYGLPFGIATNFTINGLDYLIPMVIEEPSVVAACSFAAKLARDGGGFYTISDEPIMIGQIQVLGIDNVYSAAGRIWDAKAELIALANDPNSSIVKRGGGVREIELRPMPETDAGPMLILHLLMDTRDAMGANAVNTVCEKLAPRVAEITRGRVNLRILSNLTDRRRARAEVTIPAQTIGGKEVVQAIVEASVFAENDPYRAATHNKGVMNGIDAVCIATGNDWRALEAGAHAFAGLNGHYTSMTQWRATPDGDLNGKLDVPLAVGTVGGATKVHPTARVAMKILGNPDARRLSEIIAAVGLAQNLAAIRALATEGIQRGHMRQAARQLAMTAGAKPEQVILIVERMIEENNIRQERANEIVAELRAESVK